MDETIDTYSRMLTINRHQLETEHEVHADVMFRIASRVTALRAAADAFADKLKQADAAAFMLRKGLGESDKVAEMNARNDELRLQAVAWASDARVDLARWSDLLEAWRAKGYGLKGLVTLYDAQYFALDPSQQRKPPAARTDYSAERGRRRAVE